MSATLLAVAFLALDPPDNPVLAAAKQRQEEIRSIEFVGTFTAPAERLPASTPPRPGQPAEQVRQVKSLDGYFRVLIDGDWSRVELTQRPQGATVGVRRTQTWNWDVIKHMDGPPGLENWHNTTCIIQPADGETRIAHELVAPVFDVARPLGIPRWGSWVDCHGLKPIDGLFDLDVTPTQQWTGRHERSGRTIHCLIDPTIGHVTRRLEVAQDRGNVTRTDVRFAKHESSGLWLPAEWSVEELTKDGVSRSKATVTVEKVTVNADIPDGEFDLAYPPGVVVHDNRTSARKEYLVLQDGSLSSFVRGRDREPIPTAAPTPPTGGNWFAANGAWLSGVLLVALVVGLLVARRLRRRELPSTRDGSTTPPA